MVFDMPRTRAATTLGSVLITGFRQIGQASTATIALPAPWRAEGRARIDRRGERGVERGPEPALAASVEPQVEGDPVGRHEQRRPDLRPRVLIDRYVEAL